MSELPGEPDLGAACSPAMGMSIIVTDLKGDVAHEMDLCYLQRNNYLCSSFQDTPLASQPPGPNVISTQAASVYLEADR